MELAQKHDLLIISDEIYEPFLYDEQRCSGPAAARPKLYDKTLILRGFSKSHAMTGWRLGYAAGPEAIVSQMTKLQQYTLRLRPSPLQYAALAALDLPMDDAVDGLSPQARHGVRSVEQQVRGREAGGRVLHFPQGTGRTHARRNSLPRLSRTTCWSSPATSSPSATPISASATRPPMKSWRRVRYSCSLSDPA